VVEGAALEMLYTGTCSDGSFFSGFGARILQSKMRHQN
jgi:hypothetical protein